MRAGEVPSVEGCAGGIEPVTTPRITSVVDKVLTKQPDHRQAHLAFAWRGCRRLVGHAEVCAQHVDAGLPLTFPVVGEPGEGVDARESHSCPFVAELLRDARVASGRGTLLLAPLLSVRDGESDRCRQAGQDVQADFEPLEELGCVRGSRRPYVRLSQRRPPEEQDDGCGGQQNVTLASMDDARPQCLGRSRMWGLCRTVGPRTRRASRLPALRRQWACRPALSLDPLTWRPLPRRADLDEES